MPFDMGFDFRSTAGFVIDPASSVVVLGEAYPHTYTNGNGQSINAGFDAAMGKVDASATNDPRIAGYNYNLNNASVKTFIIDLSSGSAPGAGTYLIDCAFGEPDGNNRQSFLIKDSATILIDGRNGGAGFDTALGHYIDATLTDVAATTSWTGTPVSRLFATTTCNVVTGADAVGLSTVIAYFRLTLQPPSPPSSAGGTVMLRSRLCPLALPIPG